MAILWLCSDHATMVTGQVRPVDGGWTRATRHAADHAAAMPNRRAGDRPAVRVRLIRRATQAAAALWLRFGAGAMVIGAVLAVDRG